MAWGFMVLKPSARFRELKYDGDGSGIRQLPGLSFGHKNMPRIGRRKITLECQGTLRAPTFGTLLGRIEALSRSIVSGKLELGTLFWEDN